MKHSYSKFKEAIPSLTWDKEELAQKLSQIGHETEVNGDQLVVTFTSNRKDCQDFNYLVFDLCGIFELESNIQPPTIEHGPLIPVTVEQVNKLLGSNLQDGDMQKLSNLGFGIEETGVKAPLFRTGISTVADIAEELLRKVGFDAINITELSKQDVKNSTEYNKILTIKQILRMAGLFETLTYSFSDQGKVELKNPFNGQTPYLRANLEGGLLETAARNPFMKRVACFEIGKVFTTEEKNVLGMLLTGQKNYDEIINTISNKIQIQLAFEDASTELIEKLNVKQSNPVWAQIELRDIPSLNEELLETNIPQFKTISKYPPLVRDITINSDISKVRTKISEALTHFDQLLLAEIIDSFTKPDTNETAITVRFIFQKYDSSFTDAEIQQISEKLSDFLK